MSDKLGFSLTGPSVEESNTGATTVCTYGNATVPTQPTTVRVQNQATPASFAELFAAASRTSGARVAAVAGLGDEAYSVSLTVLGVPQHTLVSRKGSIVILITTTAPADRLMALMTAILALVGSGS